MFASIYTYSISSICQSLCGKVFGNFNFDAPANRLPSHLHRRPGRVPGYAGLVEASWPGEEDDPSFLFRMSTPSTRTCARPTYP